MKANYPLAHRWTCLNRLRVWLRGMGRIKPRPGRSLSEKNSKGSRLLFTWRPLLMWTDRHDWKQQYQVNNNVISKPHVVWSRKELKYCTCLPEPVRFNVINSISPKSNSRWRNLALPLSTVTTNVKLPTNVKRVGLGLSILSRTLWLTRKLSNTSPLASIGIEYPSPVQEGTTEINVSKYQQQECIPVGCVLSTAVVVCLGVCPGGDVCPGGCFPRRAGVCRGKSAQGDVHLPLWTELLTHACENITFLLLRTVIIWRKFQCLYSFSRALSVVHPFYSLWCLNQLSWLRNIISFVVSLTFKKSVMRSSAWWIMVTWCPLDRMTDTNENITFPQL